MIDHLVGRPNPSWKRAQVFLVILFWLWRIYRGNAEPPRVLWFKKINSHLKKYSPWQIIVSTLTGLYAIRNFDKLLGLDSPEPLARLYSTSYYRATWINTGLEAGFATAMSIRPKWLRDISSVLFSAYYILYANEGDEKLRRFRAVPTVEMLRTTWAKTTNPYIRIMTRLPRISLRRKIILPRPSSSQHTRPITAYLFFHPRELQLQSTTDLILDFPGGGFVAQSPEHHEERLRIWAINTGKPVLSIDYGKAPEYPYPFAIDEAFDVYKLLVESVGRVIGMSGDRLNIIISGDSAGATLAVNVILKILEFDEVSTSLGGPKMPQPIALILSYAALDFNFTSWMSPANLAVLQSEQSTGNLPGLAELAAQKDHLQHVSPLSMVADSRPGIRRRKDLRRRASWKDAFRGLTGDEDRVRSEVSDGQANGEEGLVDSHQNQKEEDRPIRARIRFEYPEVQSPPPMVLTYSASERRQEELSAAVEQANSQAMRSMRTDAPKELIGTRLTMTSRTGYFQDRIVSPSMMRAMAILYIGLHRNPDFATDYHISPILTPPYLLAKFPPLLLQCGEKDPFVDDTVIFAGRVREAKRARKQELEFIISGKRARFGESDKLRNVDRMMDESTLLAFKQERDKLAKETEEDWVQVGLFAEWSHGYLQMPALMKEAKAVIEELATWMDNAFLRNAARSASNGGVTKADDSGITFVSKRYPIDQEEVAKPRPVKEVSVLLDEETSDTAKGLRQTAGTPISETELMRRRRLLDLDIFKSNSVV